MGQRTSPLENVLRSCYSVGPMIGAMSPLPIGGSASLKGTRENVGVCTGRHWGPFVSRPEVKILNQKSSTLYLP